MIDIHSKQLAQVFAQEIVESDHCFVLLKMDNSGNVRILTTGHPNSVCVMSAYLQKFALQGLDLKTRGVPFDRRDLIKEVPPEKDT